MSDEYPLTKLKSELLRRICYANTKKSISEFGGYSILSLYISLC
ncbi:protein of unknown function [Shewanella benthica]|uniref:Uncharacterized protein n=1 Tax=Shewanella benthica TaxID=43661 RepID=A0A330LXE7_9GAMM|nr:protein of unknown function [Shewanella benthica]SQH75789.1 protein of unknown function [Shewanella benthica]